MEQSEVETQGTSFMKEQYVYNGHCNTLSDIGYPILGDGRRLDELRDRKCVQTGVEMSLRREKWTWRRFAKVYRNTESNKNSQKCRILADSNEQKEVEVQLVAKTTAILNHIGATRQQWTVCSIVVGTQSQPADKRSATALLKMSFSRPSGLHGQTKSCHCVYIHGARVVVDKSHWCSVARRFLRERDTSDSW